MKKFLIKSSFTMATALALLTFAALSASAIPVSFPECPAVGNDTSGCELLITVTAVNGSGAATAFTVTLESPDQGPFDGADDTLVGVLNSSGGTLNSIALNGSTDIFGFDGDGACSGDYGTIPGCGAGQDPSGYAPIGVTFSGVNGAFTSGTVNFAGGIANAGSNWFSLEEALTPSSITLGGTPEPGSLLLLATGLLGVGFMLSRRNA